MRPGVAAALLLLAGCTGEVVGGEPQLDEVLPAAGSARGGEPVELRGEGLSGELEVLFGGRRAEVEAADGQTLRVLTPRAVAGPVDVVVRSPVGEARLEDAFRYDALDPTFVDAPAGYLPDPGAVPADLAAGDIDGDGDQDLVLAMPPAGLLVWANTGFGAYEPDPGLLPPYSGSPRRLVLHDLDGDGRIDLFACHGRGEADRLLRGIEGGLEPADGALPLRGSDCNDARAEDLDGDGLPDLVLLARDRHPDGDERSSLRVLLNRSEPGALRFEPDPRLEAEADLLDAPLPPPGPRIDGPGEAGLFGVPGREAGTAAALRWSGADAGAVVRVGFAVSSLAPLDRLELDHWGARGGRLRLEIEDAEGERFDVEEPGAAQALPGLGAEDPDGVGGPGVFDLPPSLVTLAVQVEADGELSFDDLRLRAADDTVVVLADFEHTDAIAGAAPGEAAVVAKDLDGDGFVDLVVSRAAGDGPALRAALQGRDGFERPAEGRFPRELDAWSLPALLPLDLDSDGSWDLFAVVRNGQDRALLNDREGFFFDESAVAVPVEGADGRGAASGDLDLDGRPELLVLNDGQADRILHPDGAGRLVDWTARAPITLDRSLRGVVVDVDGDGDLDLLTFGPDRPPRMLVSVD